MPKRLAKDAYACGLSAAFLLCLSGCILSPVYRGVSIVPPSGNRAYFGANLDWADDSPSAFNRKLGRRAAVFVRFFAYPLDSVDSAYLDSSIDLIAAEGGMALLTLEPRSGLDKASAAVADEFAKRLALYNERGVPVLIRFAHEMNGSWYPWGQQPSAYIRAFRALSDALRAKARGSAMVWAPNYGGGYPFSGGIYECLPGSEDFQLLDTNGDGVLSMLDDPYLPYYPGDDAVAWVGMSLYHWGNAYPWGENEESESGKFIAQLTGNYNGLRSDDRSLPDFYHVYFDVHGKPIAITETAALYNTEVAVGATELAIKRSWWRQVFERGMLATHPGIKMINWFEHMKPESEIALAVVDWRALGKAEIASAFLAELPTDLLFFAD